MQSISNGSHTLLSVILAGGQSSRMGQRKEWLRLQNGMSMLEQTIHTLAELTNQQVISGLQSSDERLSFALPPVIPDHAALPGPLGGMLSVMQQCNAAGYIFVACDQPRLTTELLSRLLVDATPVPTCFQSSTSNYIDPLPCYLPRSCLELINSKYQSGERSVQRILHAIGVQPIILQPDESKLLRSVNTQEEYEDLLATMRV